MPDFTVRTAEQLPILIQAFRKDAGLTQAEAASRLGVTQQTYSALERNAGKMSAERLLKLLNLLGSELVLKQRQPGEGNKPVADTPSGPAW